MKISDARGKTALKNLHIRLPLGLDQRKQLCMYIYILDRGVHLGFDVQQLCLGKFWNAYNYIVSICCNGLREHLHEKFSILGVQKKYL